jgi:phosphate transport system substrate-binding protein
MTPRIPIAVLAAGALALGTAACGSSNSNNSSTSSSSGSGSTASGTVNGAGSTFAAPVYQQWGADLKGQGLTVNYQPVGSGAGVAALAAGTAAFAGSDPSLQPADRATLKKGPVLQIPMFFGAITVSYNESGAPKDLKLDGSTIANIFLGKIKKWNDPAIAADNAGVTLPDKAITVVHRSDGSGTTGNFTKYLVAAGGASWTLGTGDTVAWPATTQGGEKNTGVAQLIKQSDGAIGYVDFADAKAGGLVFAAIKNKDGQYVAASLDGATAAVAGATIADDLTYNPLNAAGATTYPITAPTYLLLKPSYTDAAKGKLVKGFVKWLLTDGQNLAAASNFSKLPTALQQKALAQLDKVQA